MEDIGKLFDRTVSEIERMLSTKTVVGEPIEVGENTLIPLINVGFGFGVGGGEGTEPQKGSGHGGGTGGGGGVKPVALVVINSQGVRVDAIKGNASVVDKVADAVARAAHGRDASGD